MTERPLKFAGKVDFEGGGGAAELDLDRCSHRPTEGSKAGFTYFSDLVLHCFPTGKYYFSADFESFSDEKAAFS